MKKILFVHYNIYKKNRWGRTFPLAKAAVQCGLETTLLTSDTRKGIFSSKTYEDGVQIIKYKDIVPQFLLDKGFGLITIFARIAHVLLNRYEYVYIDCGEAPNTGWIGKIAQWRGSILLSEWGDLLGKGGYYDYKPKMFKLFYGRYYLWADLYFRKSANYVIVLSTLMRDYAIGRGIDEKKIKLMPGGAITDILSYDYKSKMLLNLPDEIITLGYIGIGEGDIKDFIPLLDVLKEEQYKNKFKLLLFGDKLSNETIEKYNLNNIAICCGWIDFYGDYSIAQCVDIFVLIKSHHLERNAMGWPNKLGDYMAIGRPILLNLYGDVENFVNRFPEGFISFNLNKDDIRNTLDKILGHKYNLKQMGKINRQIAENVISWNARMATMLVDIGN